MQEFKLHVENSKAKSADSFIHFPLHLNFLSPFNNN